MILLFLVSLANAQSVPQWCDIVDNTSAQVLNTYAGVCNQKQFGGPWGDPLQTHHVVNTTKAASDTSAAQAAATAQATRAARVARIKTACAAMTGPQADICNQVVDGM